MYKVIYLLENSLKRMMRLPGIFMTIVSLICFFTLAFFFIQFAFWGSDQKKLIVESITNQGLAMAQVFSIKLLFLSIANGMLIFIASLLLWAIMRYTVRLFVQYLYEQEEDILTMSYLGQTNRWLYLELVLPYIYWTLGISIISCFFFMAVILSFYKRSIRSFWRERQHAVFL